MKFVDLCCANCGKRFKADAWRVQNPKYGRKYCGKACSYGHCTARPALVRFFEKVEKTDSCWLWTGHRQNWGYGQFWMNGKLVLAHRFAFEQCYGPVPEGKVLMHSCDNPGCVNPEHVTAGTLSDNSQDMLRKGRGAWQRKKETVNV